jgi:periplasmic protein TonB
MIVFPEGGVVRLAAPVEPGETIMVTQRWMRRQAICRAVHSKSYSNVRGFLRFEFCNPQPGFWGVQFPADAAGAAERPETPRRPAASPAEPKPPAAVPVAIIPVAKPPKATPAVPAAELPATTKPQIPAVAPVENAPIPPKRRTPVAEPVATGAFSVPAPPAPRVARRSASPKPLDLKALLNGGGVQPPRREGEIGSSQNEPRHEQSIHPKRRRGVRKLAFVTAGLLAVMAVGVAESPFYLSRQEIGGAGLLFYVKPQEIGVAHVPAFMPPRAPEPELSHSGSLEAPPVSEGAVSSRQPRLAPTRQRPVPPAVRAGVPDMRLVPPVEAPTLVDSGELEAPEIRAAPTRPASAVSGGLLPTAPSPPPIGGNIQPPQLVKSVPPVYPAAARLSGVTGSVVIEAMVDEHGNVGEMNVISGHHMLRQAALDAVAQRKYEPATLNGEPVAMRLRLTIHFRR